MAKTTVTPKGLPVKSTPIVDENKIMKVLAKIEQLNIELCRTILYVTEIKMLGIDFNK